MTQLNLRVLSVDGLLLEDEVDMVVLPGLHGDIGIKSGERLFVYVLNAGILYLFKGDKVYRRYFILNGNFRAEYNSLVVNTDFPIFDLDKLNREDIKSKIQDYEDKSKNGDDVVKEYYTVQLDIYNKILGAVDINNY